jgi:hypothetical protein
MRLRTSIMMTTAGTGSWAAQAGPTKAGSVPFCMGGDPKVPPIHGVESAVSKIFSSIEVRIDWHNGSCPASLKVAFANKVPLGISSSALAYAMRYEGTHIVVFYERVQQEFNCAQRLLAYVLVHEITHILEGVTGHSATGIMKARWDGADYSDMAHNALVFTADDVKSIYPGMDLRAALENR